MKLNHILWVCEELGPKFWSWRHFAAPRRSGKMMDDQRHVAWWNEHVRIQSWVAIGLQQYPRLSWIWRQLLPGGSGWCGLWLLQPQAGNRSATAREKEIRFFQDHSRTWPDGLRRDQGFPHPLEQQQETEQMWTLRKFNFNMAYSWVCEMKQIISCVEVFFWYSQWLLQQWQEFKVCNTVIINYIWLYMILYIYFL